MRAVLGKSIFLLMGIASLCLSSCAKDPAPSTSSSAKPWEVFMGVPFGSSEAETVKIIPSLICKTDPHRNGRRECQDSKFQMGNAKTESNEFIFMNDKLIRVRFLYKTDDFEYIKNLFNEKYGKPSEESEYLLKDSDGMTLKRELVKWESYKVRVALINHDPSSLQGSAVFIDKTEENGKRKDMK